MEVVDRRTLPGAPLSADDEATRSRVLIVVVEDAAGPSGAIGWAVAEAAARGATVRIVTATDASVAGAAVDLRSRTDLVIVERRAGAVGWPPPPGIASRRGTSCPIVVVGEVAVRPPQRIVVAFDTSNAAAAALDWAADEAELHGADLTVIHAWSAPVDARRSVRDHDLARADAASIVELAVARCVARVGRAPAGVAVEGDARLVAIEASGHADLLVIGARGRSGFKTLQFGSVARLVSVDAACPVVLVQPRLATSASVRAPVASVAMWDRRP